jgi:hypothetical protein
MPEKHVTHALLAIPSGFRVGELSDFPAILCEADEYHLAFFVILFRVTKGILCSECTMQ